jgi:hypothetical protein
MDERKMKKKEFFERLVAIYKKTYKEPNWIEILKKHKERRK